MAAKPRDYLDAPGTRFFIIPSGNPRLMAGPTDGVRSGWTWSAGWSCLLVAVIVAGCIGPREVPVRDPTIPTMPATVPPNPTPVVTGPQLTPTTHTFPTFSHNPSAHPSSGPGATSSAGSGPATTPPYGSPSPSQEEPNIAPGHVTNVAVTWRNATTLELATHAPPWTTLTLSATFTLHVNGTVALEVWEEIPQAYDRPLATLASAVLTRGNHTLQGTFETIPDNVTSFVPSISVNGGTVWYPEESPPRLALDTHRGYADVTSVEWLVEGTSRSSAAPGTSVVARVTVAARGGGFVDEVYLDVRTDVAGADDHTTTTITRRVEIMEGSPQTIDIPFTVEGGSNVRGHYVHAESQGRFFCIGWVEFVSGTPCDGLKLDFQHEGYPPRLAKT